MSNKTTLYIAFVMLLGMIIIQGCASKGNGNISIEQENTTDETGQSLNDIRFGDWKDEDWLDNEYIRTLRSYLDAFNRGEVEDEELEPYRDYVKGQFVVGDASPFLAGGLFLQITFLDATDKLFGSVVYSNVDEQTKQVTSYVCLGVSLSEEDLEITKEEILEIVKEHPEIKLW